jgi:hypothetical protein
MKRLIDYIEECGEGCSTPGNTMGMGNPMPPTEEAPGSEPLCGKCKKEKKKKKVTESILDTDNSEKNLDANIIMSWLKKAAGDAQAEKCISINDDLSISIKGRLGIDLEEPIPDYIRIKEIDGRGILAIESDKNMQDLIIPADFLPKELTDLTIYHYNGAVIFKSRNLKLERFTAYGDMKSIEFPSIFKCDDLNLSSCEQLVDVKNIGAVKQANFPTSMGANLIRKYTKFKGSIKMNGFGPY